MHAITDRKRPRRIGRIYLEAAGETLLVPLPWMYGIHRLMLPRNVALRAGLSRTQYDNWQTTYGADHWLFPRIPTAAERESSQAKPRLGWLYADGPPAGKKVIHHETWKEYRQKPQADELFATPEMYRFRERTQRTAIARDYAAHLKAQQSDNGRPGEDEELLDDFTPSASYLQDGTFLEPPAPDFLAAYVFAGQKPAGVQVATPSQWAAARQAWDYMQILRDLAPAADGPPQEYTDYHGWWPMIRDDEQPGDSLAATPEDVARWAAWLFAGPEPEDWIIVDGLLVALKQQLSNPSICGEAGMHKSAPGRWRKDPALRVLLEQALQAARTAGNAPASKEWRARYGDLENLEPGPRFKREQERDNILAYAAAATITRAARRAAKVTGRSHLTIRQAYNNALAHAKELGGKELADALAAYVLDGLRGDATRYRKIAPGLFAPPPLMLRFRDLAAQRARDAHLTHHCGNIPEPLRYRWRLEWVIPHGPTKERMLAEPKPAPLAAGENGRTNEPLLTAKVSPADIAEITGRPRSQIDGRLSSSFADLTWQLTLRICGKWATANYRDPWVSPTISTN